MYICTKGRNGNSIFGESKGTFIQEYAQYSYKYFDAL